MATNTTNDKESSKGVDDPDDLRETMIPSNSREEGREEETKEQNESSEQPTLTPIDLGSDAANDANASSSVDRLVELLLKQCPKLARLCQVGALWRLIRDA